MHRFTITVVSFLFVAQLASAQETLQPVPQSNIPLQPATLPIEPIRVGVPTPAKRPAPATLLDEQVEPAGFVGVEPAKSEVVRTSAEVVHAAAHFDRSPQELLKSALTLTNSSVDGPTRPITLRETLDRIADRGQQMQAVKAYWQLFSALADYNHAWGEAQFLAGVPKPQAAHEAAILRSFQSAANARAHEARLALVAAQEDLTTAAHLSTGDSPLPSDMAFVGAYHTRFETLFSGRTAPAEMRRIHQTLPYYLTLVGSRGTAVVDAEHSLSETINAYEAGTATLRTSLDAFIHLRDQRIAFLATVRDYNQAIASYALNVTTAELSRDRVVSMLIDRRADVQSVLVPMNDVQPASAVTSESTAPRWTDRQQGGTFTEPTELVPVKPQPGTFNAPIGNPPSEPIEDSGFRLND